MSVTGLPAFDSTVQITNIWLNELMEELGWQDRQEAYHGLWAVLHALRDQLGIEDVVALAAQLPMLIRGFFYEGWQPRLESHRRGGEKEFLSRIAAALRDHHKAEPEDVSRAVLRILARHVTAGEIEHIKRSLPHGMRALWP
jgi:uncharacterized protein (DUF2267 family)